MSKAVDDMIETAAKAMLDVDAITLGMTFSDLLRKQARACFESTGIPLKVLAALVRGRLGLNPLGGVGGPPIAGIPVDLIVWASRNIDVLRRMKDEHECQPTNS